MIFEYRSVSPKDIEWKTILKHFNVYQEDNMLYIGRFIKRVFAIIDSREKKIYSHGRHLLCTQLAEHYFRIFQIEAYPIVMVSDQLNGSPYDWGGGGF
jgi:hypothetical protein